MPSPAPWENDPVVNAPQAAQPWLTDPLAVTPPSAPFGQVGVSRPQWSYGPPDQSQGGRVEVMPANPAQREVPLGGYPTMGDLQQTITGALREFWNGATLNAWQHVEAGLSSQTLPEIATERQQFQAANPGTAAFAQGLGAAAILPITGPAAAAATAGASTPARMMLGGAAGAAAGGTYGFLEPGQGTVAERAQNALPYSLWGLVGGAVAPALAVAVPAATRFLRDAINPNAAASRDVARMAGVSPITIARQMEANPNLTAADLNPQLAHAARQLATPATTNRFARRQQDVPTMVRQVVGDTIGIRPDIAAAQQALRDTASANLNRVVQPMLQTASRVQVNPVLQLMNRVLPPNSAEWRTIDNLLRPQGGVVMTDADTLYRVQSQIRRMADSYANGTPTERTMSGALYSIREQLITQLDLATGTVPNTGAGALRIALHQYKDEMDVDRAFERGLTNTLYNPTGRQAAQIIEQTPEQFARWRDGLTPEELEAARLGATSAFQNMMDGTAAGAERAFSLTAIENNRMRLAALFGDEAADAMMEGLEIVRTIRDSGAFLTGGEGRGTASAAVRAATAAPAERARGILGPLTAGVGAAAYTARPVVGAAVTAAAMTGQGISRLVSRNFTQRRQAAIERLITTAGSPGQQALANAARRPVLGPVETLPFLPFVPQVVGATQE